MAVICLGFNELTSENCHDDNVVLAHRIVIITITGATKEDTLSIMTILGFQRSLSMD